MCRHFIQYVVRGKAIGATPDPQQLSWCGPLGAGTNRWTGHVARVRSGDVIWLVSWMKVLGDDWSVQMAPSLDARIVVDMDLLYQPNLRRLRAAMHHVFPGGAGSRWLPLRDISNELLGVRYSPLRGTRSALLLGGPEAKNAGLPVGHRLSQRARSLCQVAPSSAERFETLASPDPCSPVFVSYRTASGERSAAELVAALCDRVPVWFDQWSLPSRLMELAHGATRRGIEGALLAAITSAAVCVQVNTEGYGDSVWTKKEVRVIEAVGRGGPRPLSWNPAEKSVGQMASEVVEVARSRLAADASEAPRAERGP